MKITPRERRRHGTFSLSPLRLAFLAWGDFHARPRFASSTIPEDKWGTTRSLSQSMMLLIGAGGKNSDDDVDKINCIDLLVHKQ